MSISVMGKNAVVSINGALDDITILTQKDYAYLATNIYAPLKVHLMGVTSAPPSIDYKTLAAKLGIWDCTYNGEQPIGENNQYFSVRIKGVLDPNFNTVPPFTVGPCKTGRAGRQRKKRR